MTNLPNCGAMDAAAGGSGPGSLVLPFIAGADPAPILRYTVDLAQRMTQLAGLFEEIARTQDRLRTAWPGGAAAAGADAKLTAGGQSFQRVLQAVQKALTEIQAAVALIRAMQTAYGTVVGSVNPTVAGLMSNPYTRAAATSLSVSTTASLRGYLTGVQGALDAIGLTRIITIVTALSTIANEVRGLLGDDQPAQGRRQPV